MKFVTDNGKVGTLKGDISEAERCHGATLHNSKEQLMRVATKPILSTHRRRKPCICVVDQQAHTRPTHMRDSDIIKPQSSMHRRRRSTHMHGRNPGSKQPRMTHTEVIHA
ncbi:hypothetical protein PIB30_095714 [Stylosanthes scabra]|uniref:Uncharacterized protein n=1 Tax=Stylosanthes scabra TaxID=79078 RepID=A0ABU6VWV1_9FABA|nr:hypothetical protein [Stylosanthes scabra]